MQLCRTKDKDGKSRYSDRGGIITYQIPDEEDDRDRMTTDTVIYSSPYWRQRVASVSLSTLSLSRFVTAIMLPSDYLMEFLVDDEQKKRWTCDDSAATSKAMRLQSTEPSDNGRPCFRRWRPPTTSARPAIAYKMLAGIRRCSQLPLSIAAAAAAAADAALDSMAM